MSHLVLDRSTSIDDAPAGTNSPPTDGSTAVARPTTADDVSIRPQATTPTTPTNAAAAPGPETATSDEAPRVTIRPASAATHAMVRSRCGRIRLRAARA